MTSNGWKNMDSELPEPHEIVLFCSPFLNNNGKWVLHYDTGFMMENGQICLYHDYEENSWKPAAWLKINLPFPGKQKCCDCKKEESDSLGAAF